MSPLLRAASLCVFCASIFLSAPAAYSFTTESVDVIEPTMTLQDYIEDYVDLPKGATDWKLLGTAKENIIQGKTEDGLDFGYVKPEFTPEIQALDGQEITLKGYMFPLDQGDDQSLFLFGPFPLTCPFQYHVGPSLVVEVHAQEHPIAFNYEAITIKGIFEVVPEDRDYSVFYRLQNASLVQQPQKP